MKRELTCIVCPMGCQLEAEVEDNRVISVEGNTCKRGEEYAKAECINPVRVITTTIEAENGVIVPVKTDKAVPKKLIFDCMEIINSLHPALNECAVGSIVYENILNTGANVIVTAPIRQGVKK